MDFTLLQLTHSISCRTLLKHKKILLTSDLGCSGFLFIVAPSPPEILEIDAGVDNMEIHWKISTVDPDSPVLNYLVQVKVKDESSQWMNCTEITFQISSSAMLCVMSELKSSTEYTVRVAARNVVGYSAFTIKESSTREKKSNNQYL